MRLGALVPNLELVHPWGRHCDVDLPSSSAQVDVAVWVQAARLVKNQKLTPFADSLGNGGHSEVVVNTYQQKWKIF